MQEAFREKDWKTLSGQAHQVKGTAGSLGFPDFTEKAKYLEAALKKNEIDDVQCLFDALINEATQAIERFKQAEQGS